MSGGYPLGQMAAWTDQGVSTSTSVGTALTSGAANTEGSWTQLVAATAIDADQIMVICGNNTGDIVDNYAFDIGIGAAGSEVIVAQNLLISTDQFQSQTFLIPIGIPAGTRLAARVQSNGAAQAATCCVMLLAGGASIPSFAGMDTIGFNAAATTGTAIAPNATANTKGNYTQLIAATTNDYAGFLLAFDGLNASPATQSYLIDLAIGAAASEVNIVSNYHTWNGRGPSLYIPIGFFLPIPIPLGSRISARCQSSIGTGGSIGLTFYGVYQ